MSTLLVRWPAGYLVLILGICPAPAASPDPVSAPRVLFLGDEGHHRPADRFKQLQPAFAQRGIELVYTDDLADLNPSKLTGFDCLAIYANTTRISPGQEKALLEFVAAGGGLAAIHCASYCFHNSSNYVDLVGAQFRSHGTGVFQETVVQPDHPVMRGLLAIESWDETYVHTRHNTNRIVLAERRDAGGAEPWTWVREHGQGRVFYTAWGHDQRTWSNAGFQALLENGIRWASANSRTQLKPRAGLKPFDYQDAAAPLPNYTPNAQWGTQGEPIRTMQRPLDPAESMEHLVTFPEFEISLFAAEPDILKPIWLAWDERGRAWIAETVDYPNELQPDHQGRDRLKICEDTNGDGKADRFTVFAESLSIPTGFVFTQGGVIVIHSGRTEFFKDSDGDGRAEERRTLFSGWGMRDTHATASNLRYGFDGWIWGTVGYSGFQGTVGGKAIRFGQGIFRFKPDGSALEFVRSSNNNTWGLGFTEDNLVFGSTANGNASMYLAIPNRYYEAVNGWSPSRLETIADSQRFYPLTDKVRQVDFHGRYTAGSGSAIYTARAFPSEYWNRVQFVAEPTGHLLGKFHLEPRGADFVAHNGRNFAASDDEWAAPIYGEVGPDGALWLVDWYNYIIQHNPTPRGFRTGKGAAYDTPLRDKAHGRIYRIACSEARSPTTGPLDPAQPDRLVAALKRDNLFWRLHAQRLLIERGQTDVVPALCRMAADPGLDAIGLNPAALHALWTLQGLGVLDGSHQAATAAAIGALRHPSPAVRRAAATVLPRTEPARTALLDHRLLEDPDAQVRLAALLSVAEMPPSDAAASAVFAFLQHEDNAKDRWLTDAAIAAAARNDAQFLRTALENYRPAGIAGPGASPTNLIPNASFKDPRFDDLELTPAAGAELPGAIGQVVRLVTTHYAQRGPEETILPTLAALRGASTPLAVAVLEGLTTGWPEGRSPALDQGASRGLGELMDALPEAARDRLLALAQRWGRPDLFGERMAAIIETLKSRVLEASLNDLERAGAARRLLGLADEPGIVDLLLNQVTLLTSPTLATGLINAMAESRHPATAPSVLGRWNQFTPAVRRAVIAVLMRRTEGAMALLEAVQEGRIGRTDLAPEHWSQLKQNPNRGVARRAERLAEVIPGVSADREATVKQFLPLAQEKGDPARGQEVFTANCAVCHSLEGQGGKVGPDLTGIGSRDRADILLEILDPNRSVEANYRLWNVTTADGETFSGRLDAETQTTVEIFDTTSQKHVIQRKDIASVDVSALSIMPTGFEALPQEDLTALLEYLSRQGSLSSP